MPAPSKPTLTLEGLYAFISQCDQLAPSKRQEMRSAIKRFAEVCGLAMSAILAEPGSVRAAMENASWQLHDLSKGSWANIQSRLTKAMELAGVNVHRRRRFMMDPAWSALLSGLDEGAKRDLRRFAGWCSCNAVAPTGIGAEDFERYLQYLTRDSVLTNSRERWHVARRAWNRAVVEKFPDYPKIPNNEPDGWRGLPWSAFPPSLKVEADTYRARMIAKNPFALGLDSLSKRRKPLAEVTVDGYLASLRQHASRLAEKGVPIDKLGSLRGLIEPQVVMDGLNLILGDRELDAARPSLHALMTAVLSVASYLGVQGDHLVELKRLAAEARHRPAGMCERNRKRLRPFDDNPEALRRLIKLPLVVAARLTKVTSPTFKQAKLMQTACLLEVLLHAPLRIKNAAALDLTKHFHFSATKGTSVSRLHIPKNEVKNDRAIDVEFGGQTTALIGRYISVFRPGLGPGTSSALFISNGGQQKGASALSKQFRKFIHRELGLTVNAHLMRHLMAFAYLRARPGDYEGARQLLGHKQIATTIKFYAGMEDAAAHRELDRIVDRSRRDLGHVQIVDEL